VILSGGAANSEAWCRVFAGAIGRKVETSDASQAGARGVAMAAAIGTGRYAGYEEAEAAMSRADKRFDPVLQERKAYEEAYARWREAASLLGRLG
jgi:sugar (pentulose or hexulose) kinase